MPPVKKPKSGILKESNTDNQMKKEDIFARAARGSKITKAKVLGFYDNRLFNGNITTACPRSTKPFRIVFY